MVEYVGETLAVHPSTKISKEKLKIAVVGTGIAGLSCAYLLSLSHDVTIFERERELGMDAHSVNVGPKTRVDAPPRAFSPSYYKNLWNLYQHAGVDLQPFSWAYSLSIFGAKRAYFRVGSYVYGGYRLPSFNGNLLQLLRPNTWIVAYEALRFFRNISFDYQSEHLSRSTVGEYLKRGRFSDRFVRGALLPMLSMILTCSYEACLEYPMDVVANYLLTNSSHTQYRTTHGSQDAVKKLSSKCTKIHLNTTVQAILHAENGGKAQLVYICPNSGDTKHEKYDHIVVASQANAVLKIVTTLSSEEKAAFSAIPHQHSVVEVHRDSAMMPSDKRDWSPMNFIQDTAMDCTMFTMWLSQLDSEEGRLFQTLNPVAPVDKKKRLSRCLIPRPVMTHGSCKALRALRGFQGRGQVWYCGAYALRNLPLQENGVRSGIQISQALGIDIPWYESPAPNFNGQAKLSSMDSLYGVELSDRILLQPKKEGEEQTYWMNFGTWEKGAAVGFAEAACNLATRVGQAAHLTSLDSVLDVGFGCGDQLGLWARGFGVYRITGIDAVPQQVKFANKVATKLQNELHNLTFRLCCSNAEELPFKSESFDKVVSVDSAYHFDTRRQFLEETYRVLKPGGKMAMTDATVDRFAFRWLLTRSILQWFCALFSVPIINMCSFQALEDQFSGIGFIDVCIEDITPSVFPGFRQYAQNQQRASHGICQWFRYCKFVLIGWLLEWFAWCGLRYIIVSATKPPDKVSAGQYWNDHHS